MTKAWHGEPIPHTDRDDWLEKRKAGIGASDVAGILGLSPWATPFTVWADKTQGIVDVENESMYWGRTLEDAIVDEFERRSGLHVHGRQWLVRHPDYEWVLSTIDGMAFDSPDVADPNEEFDMFAPLGVVEVKTDTSFGRWADGVPDHVRIQVQWQMFTTGLDKAWVVVLHNGRTYEEYEVDYDQSLIDVIFKEVSEFRDRYIVGDEMPDPDGSDATSAVVKGLWEADEDKVIELSDSEAADLEALRGWKTEAKKVDAEIKRLENRIKVSMQTATVGTVGGFEAVTYKPVVQRRVDTTRLKEERLDVWEKYAVPSEYRRFYVKETK